ncbi:MAG: hypothetical protein CL466_06965 [Acidimicrobiaceae bacterium]|nr:hypothetical protein [Acidimicrobiaceae bacterium]
MPDDPPLPVDPTPDQGTEAPTERSSPEAGTEVSDDLRSRRAAFFRKGSRTSPVADQPRPTGGRWSETEADRQIRTFLIRLADGRELVHREDPVELLRENDLLLLFGPQEEEAFAELALRFPDETVTRWATLLSGGDRTEAFGPRSRAERRDEATILRELQVGVRKRVASVLLLVVALFALVLGGRALLSTGPKDRSDRALRFAGAADVVREGEQVFAVEGGAPVAEPVLVAPADQVVAVLRGDGPPDDRIRLDVPAAELPVPVGVLAATVFEHHGGQVALVGPNGWWAEACIRVTVSTGMLRPLDVVLHEVAEGACPDGLVGRPARVTCVGRAVLMLAVDIPQGSVELDEGGLGWAEVVRFAVEGAPSPTSAWEVLSVRGAISVPHASGADAVAVPAFGGTPGDVVRVEFGGDVLPSGPAGGDCTLA